MRHQWVLVLSVNMNTLSHLAWAPINGVARRSARIFQLPLTDSQIADIAAFGPFAIHVAGPRIERPDFGFLRALPSVRAVAIFDSTVDVRTDDLAGLTDLCEVSLGMGQRTAINIAKLPSLSALIGYWGDALRLTLEGARLDSVCILEYRCDSFSDIPTVHGLRSLMIPTARARRLEIPGWMCTLEELDLKGGKRLAMWGEFDLPKLKYLNLDGCRALDSIQPAFSIGSLETLTFANVGKRDSLDGIDRLRRLERVIFYGSTDIRDGDLRPLLSLPRLKAVAFANRKHYNLTLDQLERFIESRTKENSA